MQQSLPPTLVVKPCDHVRREASVNEQWVLIDSNSNQAHQLNPTASIVWDACDGKNSVAMITEVLLAQFDVEETQALQDVSNAIAHLLELGVLEIVE